MAERGNSGTVDAAKIDTLLNRVMAEREDFDFKALFELVGSLPKEKRKQMIDGFKAFLDREVTDPNRRDDILMGFMFFADPEFKLAASVVVRDAIESRGM